MSDPTKVLLSYNRRERLSRSSRDTLTDRSYRTSTSEEDKFPDEKPERCGSTSSAFCLVNPIDKSGSTGRTEPTSPASRNSSDVVEPSSGAENNTPFRSEHDFNPPLVNTRTTESGASLFEADVAFLDFLDEPFDGDEEDALVDAQNECSIGSSKGASPQQLKPFAPRSKLSSQSLPRLSLLSYCATSSSRHIRKQEAKHLLVEHRNDLSDQSSRSQQTRLLTPPARRLKMWSREATNDQQARTTLILPPRLQRNTTWMDDLMVGEELRMSPDVEHSSSMMSSSVGSMSQRSELLQDVLDRPEPSNRPTLRSWSQEEILDDQSLSHEEHVDESLSLLYLRDDEDSYFGSCDDNRTANGSSIADVDISPSGKSTDELGVPEDPVQEICDQLLRNAYFGESVDISDQEDDLRDDERSKASTIDPPETRINFPEPEDADADSDRSKTSTLDPPQTTTLEVTEKEALTDDPRERLARLRTRLRAHFYRVHDIRLDNVEEEDDRIHTPALHEVLFNTYSAEEMAVENMDWVLELDDPISCLYSGPVVGGLPHGIGSLRFNNGDLYVGPFYEGRMHGDNATHTGADGSTYVGSYLNNARHGHGELKSEGGRTYIGRFVNDCADGYGESFHPDGRAFYLGQWKRGWPAHKYEPFIYQPTPDDDPSMESSAVPLARDNLIPSKKEKDRIRATRLPLNQQPSVCSTTSLSEVTAGDCSYSTELEQSFYFGTQVEMEHHPDTRRSKPKVDGPSELQLAIKRLRDRMKQLEGSRIS